MYYLQPLLSSLLRFLSFVFLRIIPTRLAQPVLPSLYVLYLLATYLYILPPPPLQNGKDEKPAKLAKTQDPWYTLLFSLPTQSRALKWTNIGINTLLVAACADLALTPFLDPAHDVTYTRVGAVYPDSVKIQVRYPTNDTLLVLYREALPVAVEFAPEWKVGPQVQPLEEFDWVDTVHLTDLWPNTLTTLNNTPVSVPQAPIPFRTFPDSRLHTGSQFRFIATSCVTPNFPYRGPFFKRSIPGFDLLADYLEPQPEPEPVHDLINATNGTNATLTVIPNKHSLVPTDFLLFLGDFIYADVPIYIGDTKEAYRRLYRRNYASPSFRRVYERLPIIHAYDDHEFINNYVGNSQQLGPYENASAAYHTYAGKPNYSPALPDQSFFSFQHGDVAFFVMDTRRYRSPVDDPEMDYRTMLGDEQLTALFNWLGAVNSTSSFKFIVTSVPFTSLWGHDAQIDSWAAYPVEKAALLQAFHSVPNVILVSGDRHEFAAVEFNSPDPAHHLVREISTSPLSMFYIPFIHTLRPQSAEFFVRNVTVAENITEEAVPYERVVKYIPHGNTKWSTFKLDTRNSNKPKLTIVTHIDGTPEYHLSIIGAPLKPPVTSLGALVTTNVKDLFDKIGLAPGRWF